MLWTKLKKCQQHTTLLGWWDTLKHLLLHIYVGAKSRIMYLMRKVSALLSSAQLASDLMGC